MDKDNFAGLEAMHEVQNADEIVCAIAGAEMKGEKGPRKAEEKEKWFVLRDLKRFNSLLPGYKQLAELNFEVFTPMHEVKKVIRGKEVTVSVPFITDLLFVKSRKTPLDQVINQIPTLQYRFVKGGGYMEAMVVPNLEMERFIAAVNNKDPEIKTNYLTLAEIKTMHFGKKVRIHGGRFDGYEGIIRKVRGSAKKRLIISLQGLIFAETVLTDFEYLEPIEENNSNEQSTE